MPVSSKPGMKGPGRWSTFGQTPPAVKKPMARGGYERQSPGVYRGPQGLVNSTSNPGRIQPKGPVFGGGLGGYQPGGNPGGVGLSPPPQPRPLIGDAINGGGPPGSIPLGNDIATPPIRPGIAPQGMGPTGIPPQAGAPGGQPMPQPNPNLWNAFGAALQRPQSPRGEISY